MDDSKGKSIFLPQNSKLTEDAVKYLDDIFDYSSPEEYRETLIEVYQVYIMNEHKSLPQEFEHMAGHLYFLINFFKKIAAEMKEPR
ncbi:hypothetical protein [Ohtaekwangia koreensis]|uniref:Uncharacterized protein n=1 Tax=Ohtaekwangia koreensis TaxID=688867 RepID=A0A1T5K6C8_9BACT|nr:hypothetical protein [Ohtaekwangia koreensis]SKC59174.1 hypothetical protein SAMN05660236_1857 [Ohtaekwangia koreensis]